MSIILENWVKGRGLPGVLVIDGHIHISEWPHATTFHSVNEAVEQSLLYLDASGVDAFCAVSGGYIFGMYDYHLGNDFLLEVWQRIPNRLIPFMSVNPNDKQANILAELRRMVNAGVRCIKLINAYQGNYPGDGPNLMALYAFAAEHNMLIFDHAWTEQEITKIASIFQQTNFIFGHYWGGYQDDVMVRFPNVYANIWNYGGLGWLERGIRTVGAHKFMMGSDGFLNCLSVGIGPVVFADIPDGDKKKILGLTCQSLLQAVGALPDSLQKMG